MTFIDNASKSELLVSSRFFPKGFRHLSNPPSQLYVVGSVELLQSPQIAIVGARKPTPYGIDCARRFAIRAASVGITVVSGGAIGCDQAAHKGALEAGGKTVVVLGCGADVVYPRRAAALFAQIVATGGALVSEVPWQTPPLRWAFRNRNRLIAALSQATLIVEAGLPSGTFQTADATLFLGNELFVVPGSINSKESRGSNRLILQGAAPIVDDESFDDALRSVFGADIGRFAPVTGAGADAAHTGEQSARAPDGLSGQIRAALIAQPMRTEEIAATLSLDVLSAIRQLTAMELDNQVERLRDGRYAALH
ncbi:MAG: DNA-processing protein DprA [Coriobacteriales bacterium]|jgi:DNA processing protein|nr:DNA-processing protein DprA [Coriobacteriales bacterium]